MGKRALKRRIESLQRRIIDHELMINFELLKSNPDPGLIQHWKREIVALKISIDNAQKRLNS